MFNISWCEVSHKPTLDWFATYMFNQLADCISICMYIQTGHFNKCYSILFCMWLELVRVIIVYSVVFIIMKQLAGYTHQWGL